MPEIYVDGEFYTEGNPYGRFHNKEGCPDPTSELPDSESVARQMVSDGLMSSLDDARDVAAELIELWAEKRRAEQEEQT